MTQGIEFPVYTKLVHKPDGKTEAEFVAAVDAILARSKRSIDDFAKQAQTRLDSALSVKRNEAGALDLGVPQLREAAQAQQLRAQAAEEVAQATLAAARATGTFTAADREAIASARALAAAEGEKARAMLASADSAARVQAELNRSTSALGSYQASARGARAANDNWAGSTRQNSAALSMANQQVADFAVQVANGTRASTALSQQLPQLGFALAGLADSTNAKTAALGRMAAVMSGPLGVAIGLGIGSLIDLALRTDDATDATKRAEFAAYAFGDAQSILGGVIDLTTGKITAQSEALIVLARAQALAGKIESQRQQATARAEMVAIRKGSVQVRGGFGGGLSVERVGDPTADVVSAYQDGTLSIREAERALASLQRTGLVTEEQYLRAAQAVTGFAVAAENAKVFDQAERALNGDTGALRGFLRPTRNTRGSRGSRSDADKRARELESLEKLADSAAERIAHLNERFDAQPRLIDQAAQATRQLDRTIAELSKRKPENFEALIADAEKAKATIETALLRPIAEMRLEAERRGKVEALTLAGREQEAEVLQTLWQLERSLGAAAWDHRDAVEEIVEAEHRRSDALRKAREEQTAYLEATRSIRDELESLLAGEGANFGQVFKRLQARLTVESLFGDAFDKIEAQVRSSYDTKVDYLAAETSRAGDAASGFADALQAATARLGGEVKPSAFTGSGAAAASLAGLVAGGNTSLAAFASRVRTNATGEIVVEGKRTELDPDTIGGMSPELYAELVSKSLAGPIIAQLEQLGIKLPTALQGALGGALGGYMTAGPIGGVLGGLKGLELGGKLGAGIDKAFAGAQTGAQFDAIFDAIGIKSSKTGATIGGSVGALLPIPFGKEIGAVVGGLLGGALKSTKRGSAIIGGGADGLGVTGFYGNSGTRKDQASGFGNSAIEAVNRLAQQLGANVDASKGKVSIGVREDKIYVDPQGRGYTKASKFPDIKGFGDDADAAIRYAVQNLIEDGVITGLKASEMRLLKAGDDIEKAMQDVLDFRSVFNQLRAYKDPVGAALDELDTEFNRLEDLFTRAGASAEELAQLEELYGIRRAEAVEQAMDRVGGALRELVNDLTRGDMGLSLRDRRANTLGEYEALRARVEGGDVTAFDKYAEVARQLLEIERELFGSQTGYFDRFNEVKGTGGNALAEQQRIADAAANRDSPFAQSPALDTGPVVDSIRWLGDHLLTGLDQAFGGHIASLSDRLDRLAQASASNINSTGPGALLPRAVGY